MYEGSDFSNNLTNTHLSNYYKHVSWSGVRSHSSLMTNDVEHLFMYLLSICIFFIQKCLFRLLAHFNCINYLWKIFLNIKNIYLPTYLIVFPWSSLFCVGPNFYLVYHFFLLPKGPPLTFHGTNHLMLMNYFSFYMLDIFKVLTPLSSNFHYFWWEICCHCCI